ncbi:MAG: hypothetical protein M1419_04650 [Bacteroidetes bacterium]|nr:hypothetical protein [Bacteroidota bacterium]
MQSTMISDIIENFDSLSIEDKEYARELIEKNIIESKREKLVMRVSEAKANYTVNKVKRGGLKELKEDLDSY